MQTLSPTDARLLRLLAANDRDELLAATITGTPQPGQEPAEVQVRRPYHEHAETVVVDLNKLRRNRDERQGRGA